MTALHLAYYTHILGHRALCVNHTRSQGKPLQFSQVTPEVVSMSPGKDSSLFLLITAFVHLNFVHLLHIITTWHPISCSQFNLSSTARQKFLEPLSSFKDLLEIMVSYDKRPISGYRYNYSTSKSYITVPNSYECSNAFRWLFWGVIAVNNKTLNTQDHHSTKPKQCPHASSLALYLSELLQGPCGSHTVNVCISVKLHYDSPPCPIHDKHWNIMNSVEFPQNETEITLSEKWYAVRHLIAVKLKSTL